MAHPAEFSATIPHLPPATITVSKKPSVSRTVAMVDSSKFARPAMAVVCPAAAVDVVITDADAPDDVVAALLADSIEVIRV